MVDSRGATCPQPIIDIAQVASRLAPGARLVLLSDDITTATDLPAWCKLKGHHFFGDYSDNHLSDHLGDYLGKAGSDEGRYLVELGSTKSSLEL